jgi:hypothetical protein
MKMDAKFILAEIQEQRALSNQVTNVVLDALAHIYYPGFSRAEIPCAEIGSYGRGTNNDPEPDIDVMFLGIPNDPQQGFFNWLGRGTFEMTQNPEGITLLSQVQDIDPKLARAITETTKHIESHFQCHEQARFNLVRSWEVFPGVVFNISAPIPGYEQLGFDINLYHKTEYFGVEHTQRFIQYLKRLRLEMGEQAAAELILNIRQVKQAAKDDARDPDTGKINKAKKVWGIVVEVLFTHSCPPPSRAELSAQIASLDQSSFPSVHAGTDYTYPIQVIGEKLSLKNVLDAGWEVGLLHERNWQTFVKAIEPHG